MYFQGLKSMEELNYISTVNISELYNNNASLLEYSKNNNSVKINIDSHSNANETLSNILTGLFLPIRIISQMMLFQKMEF